MSQHKVHNPPFNFEILLSLSLKWLLHVNWKKRESKEGYKCKWCLSSLSFLNVVFPLWVVHECVYVHRVPYVRKRRQDTWTEWKRVPLTYYRTVETSFSNISSLPLRSVESETKTIGERNKDFNLLVLYTNISPLLFNEEPVIHRDYRRLGTT